MGGIATYIGTRIDRGSCELPFQSSHVLISQTLLTAFPDKGTIVFNVYFPPKPSTIFKSQLADIVEAMQLYVVTFPEDIMILVGDFNARQGGIEALHKCGEMLDSLWLILTSIPFPHVANAKGLHMWNTLTPLTFRQVNGRYGSQQKVMATYWQARTPSILDLVWIQAWNWPLFTGLEGEPRFESEHFTLITSLKLQWDVKEDCQCATTLNPAQLISAKKIH